MKKSADPVEVFWGNPTIGIQESDPRYGQPLASSSATRPKMPSAVLVGYLEER